MHYEFISTSMTKAKYYHEISRNNILQLHCNSYWMEQVSMDELGEFLILSIYTAFQCNSYGVRAETDRERSNNKKWVESSIFTDRPKWFLLGNWQCFVCWPQTEWACEPKIEGNAENGNNFKMQQTKKDWNEANKKNTALYSECWWKGHPGEDYRFESAMYKKLWNSMEKPKKKERKRPTK